MAVSPCEFVLIICVQAISWPAGSAFIAVHLRGFVFAMFANVHFTRCPFYMHCSVCGFVFSMRAQVSMLLGIHEQSLVCPV
jgi:hypothetical protein